MADLIFQKKVEGSTDLVFEASDFIELGEYDLEFKTESPVGTDIVFGLEVPKPLGQYDLLFEDEVPEGSDIIFGAKKIIEGQLPEITGELTLGVVLPKVEATANYIRYLYGVVLELPVPRFRPSVEYSYHINTFRGVSASAFSGFSETAQVSDAMSLGFSEAKPTYGSTSVIFSKGIACSVTTKATFTEAYRVKTYVHTLFEAGQPVKEVKYTQAQETVGLARSTRTLSESADPMPLVFKGGHFQDSDPILGERKVIFQKGEALSHRWGYTTNYSEPVSRSFAVGFESAEHPINKVSILPPIEPPPTITFGDPFEHDILFKCSPSDQELDPEDYSIVFNNCVKAVDPVEPPTPPSTNYTEPYFVINSIELTNLETGEIVQATSVDFSTDLNSFAWSGSMSVPANQISKLESPTNKPVKVGLTFNGNYAVFMVQKISKATTFNKASYTVSVISPTALLDEPYSRSDSATIMQDASPQALIEARLNTQVTGVGLDWQYLSSLDWVVTAKTFSYQELTPIKAIGKLLEGSAAFLYSALAGDSLVVKRKRVNEFWESAIEPILINSDIITSLSFTREKHRDYDAVYVVSGLGNVSGITARVVRDAYAGTELAPQIVAPTLTSPQAVRDAGKYRLGTAGVVETRTLSQPVIEGAELLKPADLVQFTLDGVVSIGTVQSTSISLKFNHQYQNFTVEVVKGFN